jgi:hypothetical protein
MSMKVCPNRCIGGTGGPGVCGCDGDPVPCDRRRSSGYEIRESGIGLGSKASKYWLAASMV